MWVFVAIGALGLLFGPPVLHQLTEQRKPVPDSSARASDIRAALPALIPVGATSTQPLVVTDVRCEPFTPAKATEVWHVPGSAEAVELGLRRQMADIDWRDVPERSHVGAKSVTMRYQHSLGRGRGTVTYVVTGSPRGTTVRFELVGTVYGRCGVK